MNYPMFQALSRLRHTPSVRPIGSLCNPHGMSYLQGTGRSRGNVWIHAHDRTKLSISPTTFESLRPFPACASFLSNGPSFTHHLQPVFGFLSGVKLVACVVVEAWPSSTFTTGLNRELNINSPKVPATAGFFLVLPFSRPSGLARWSALKHNISGVPFSFTGNQLPLFSLVGKHTHSCSPIVDKWSALKHHLPHFPHYSPHHF